MSYTLTLPCQCVVYVSCHPVTRVAHTRIIQSRSLECRNRSHEVGRRLFLWEMLPDTTARQQLVWLDDSESTEPREGSRRMSGGS